jgi:hypothetical protein
MIGVSATNCAKGRHVIRVAEDWYLSRGRCREPMGWLYVEGLISVHAALRASQSLPAEAQDAIVKKIKLTPKAARARLARRLLREALAARKNSQPGSKT